jgi:hypothetical protein
MFPCLWIVYEETYCPGFEASSTPLPHYPYSKHHICCKTTHRHQQAFVLLDRAHAAQEGDHHDNGAHDDKYIAQREEREIMEEHPKAVVDQEVDPKTQNATATELKGRIPQHSKAKYGS